MATVALRDYIERVETMLAQGQYDRVIRYCQHALRTSPRCVDFYRLLGQACMESGRPDDAYTPSPIIFSRSTVLNLPSAISGQIFSSTARAMIVSACSRRPMRQWMMRITAYVERLLEDSKELDWPASTLEQQRNWIGKSEGAFVDFPTASGGEAVRVFTTRPDTIFGATYMVLAPEHPLVDSLTTAAQRPAVSDYRAKAKLKSDLERGIDTEKTGVFTGSSVLNPANRKEIPVWIADYVLMGYGTGAIMAVPGQDERDWEFAEKFGLPIVRTVQPPEDFPHKPYTGDGPAINSGFLDGLHVDAAKSKIIDWVESNGLGRKATQYKLRDWLFSRQRYWGEPIPIIHLEDGTMKGVAESDLPLLLPDLKKFQPSGTTESPLALATDWVNIVDKETGLKGRRETNTMPQWAGSCWYYLRYIDPQNSREFCAKEKEQYWMPVDFYVGGAEHAVLHLMYARFWHKVLFDLGYVSTKEPFVKLRHQGTILGEDSRKMSKSRGNVVNPDDVVKEYGADAMRLFEMFMGPLEETKPWSTRGVEGVFRFLNRAWRMILDEEGNVLPSVQEVPLSEPQERLLHQTIKKVTNDLEAYEFNTIIAALMTMTNGLYKLREATDGSPDWDEAIDTLLKLMAPITPHIAEELWVRRGNPYSIHQQMWPAYDAAAAAEELIMLVVQINGKVRDRIEVAADISEAAAKAAALASEQVQKHLEGREPKKIVYVTGKLVSIVV